MIKSANVFYFAQLNAIGGVESWLYYVARMYQGYDMTVVYRSGNEDQIRRLKKMARCVKWDGKEEVECDRLFVNYNPEILNSARADEVIFVVHSDYSTMVKMRFFSDEYVRSIVGDKRINRFIAVSKVAQRSFYELSGVMPELCYNPIVLEEPTKLVRLCSAQRMGKEKGERRIAELASVMDLYCLKHQTMYQWDIFTNNGVSVSSPNVVVRQPILEVNRVFGYYDYFVALSEAEAFCYSVVEALMRGTPCVVTPCPVFEEIGVNKDNSIQLAFDCGNVNQVVEDIFHRQFSFSYEPPESAIGKYLKESETDYEYRGVSVKATSSFIDIYENRTIQAGEVYETEETRALYLIEKGLVVGVN